MKLNGYLLCNDSHGDATLAKGDSDYEFIGVVMQNENHYYIDSDRLSEYFVLPKGKQVNLREVQNKMKGPKYSLCSENYIFKKIK